MQKRGIGRRYRERGEGGRLLQHPKYRYTAADLAGLLISNMHLCANPGRLRHDHPTSPVACNVVKSKCALPTVSRSFVSPLSSQHLSKNAMSTY